MVFSSLTFLLLFLPVALGLYFLAPGRTAKNVVLLISSLVFYAWGEPVYVVLMIVSTLNDYSFALLATHLRDRGRMKTARLCVAAAVLVNLLLLGTFKYAGFLAENLGALLGMTLPDLQLPLPIGISFYTFQTMSYTFDVWRGKVRPQRNLLTMATYVTLFPQLIAGPIVRYADVARDLTERKDSVDGVAAGLRRFIVGLAKKVLLANQAGIIASAVFDAPPAESGTPLIWLGALAYTFQIYYDFSGYSDMAIGLGRMFGFTFPENFLHPYRAGSVTDFWRRWHVSLSSWFRDYVYIPLGGNRVRPLRQVLNLVLVWFLTGLWHGASWNYVLWGLWYALFLILEKAAIRGFGPRAMERETSAPRSAWHPLALLHRLATALIVVFGWVLFRVEHLPTLGVFLSRMVSWHPQDAVALLGGQQPLLQAAPFLVVALACAFGWPRKEAPPRAIAWLRDPVLLVLLLLSLVFLVGERFNPFIYFRF